MPRKRNRVRLTNERIKDHSLQPGERQSFLWDAEAPRLAVRATAGSKSFVFESKLNRATIRITLGDVRDWLVDDARKKARELQKMIDDGLDPRVEKAERIAATEAKREKLTRKEAPALIAWADYIEARRHQWQELHHAAHTDAAKEGGEPRPRGRKGITERGILRPLLTLPLEAITPAKVESWLKDEASKRPTRARGAFALLRAFINWCADHEQYREQVHADACNARNTRRELPQKKAKQDVLLREQLRVWFQEVRKIHNPTIAAYFQGLLLTGARPGELVALKWSDVDFRWNSISIKDKIEGVRVIPLTPYFRSLILDLPRRNQWVFAGPRAKSGHIAEPSAQH